MAQVIHMGEILWSHREQLKDAQKNIIYQKL